MSFHRCWEPKVLQKMSSHYETQKPLSAELIGKLVKRLVVPLCNHTFLIALFAVVT